MKHVISISGGKDSTALRLLAIEREVEHVAVFCDTGHEHALTYEYIDYLEKKTGPIIRVKADYSEERFAKRREFISEKWPADGVPSERVESALKNMYRTGNPFLDMCKLKGRFPSTRARFCSQDLKHVPIRRFIDSILDNDDIVISWQGVRADESRARHDLDIVEELDDGLITYRPIITWTIDDVFSMHDKHGIDPNPLYKMGMSRVGCMPCIHERKLGLREIAMRFPGEIDRVERWESEVRKCSKSGDSTLFPISGTVLDDGKKETYMKIGIRDYVEWSKTTRGGKQYDLMSGDEPSQCSSLYGLCE